MTSWLCRHVPQPDGEIFLVAYLFLANVILHFKQRNGAARLSAQGVGVGECVESPCLGVFIFSNAAVYLRRQEIKRVKVQS